MRGEWYDAVHRIIVWVPLNERYLISRPEYCWEKKGNSLVNGGPEILVNCIHFFVLFRLWAGGVSSIIGNIRLLLAEINEFI